MQSVIEYNSWDKNFKAPFGALKFDEELTICVKVNEGYNIKSISLEINREEEMRTITLNEELDNDKLGKCFCGKIEKFDGTGVYFYYFKVDVEMDGQIKTLFYGKTEIMDILVNIIIVILINIKSLFTKILKYQHGTKKEYFIIYL